MGSNTIKSGVWERLQRDMNFPLPSKNRTPWVEICFKFFFFTSKMVVTTKKQILSAFGIHKFVHLLFILASISQTSSFVFSFIRCCLFTFHQIPNGILKCNFINIFTVNCGNWRILFNVKISFYLSSTRQEFISRNKSKEFLILQGKRKVHFDVNCGRLR